MKWFGPVRRAKDRYEQDERRGNRPAERPRLRSESRKTRHEERNSLISGQITGRTKPGRILSLLIFARQGHRVRPYASGVMLVDLLRQSALGEVRVSVCR